MSTQQYKDNEKSDNKTDFDLCNQINDASR